MSAQLVVFHTPSVRIAQSPHGCLVREIRDDEAHSLTRAALEACGRVQVEDSLLTLVAAGWPCVLASWHKHPRPPRHARLPKATLLILCEKEVAQFVSGEHFWVTRSKPGLLEILLTYEGTVDVAMARAGKWVSLCARWLDLEITMGDKGNKMDLAIQVSNRTNPYDEGIDVRISNSVARLLPGGVVFLSGTPGDRGVVYIAADPRPLLTLIPTAARELSGILRGFR